MVAPAWAIPSTSPNVLIAVSAIGPVSYEWACNYADIWERRPAGTSRMRLPPYVIDQSRETGAETAVGNRFKWIFFLDSDVLPPPDVINRLIAHNKPIVSGFYSRRHPPIYPLLLRKTSDNPIKFDLIRDFTPGTLVEVDACPAGCMLVSTDALRKIPKPWFYWSSGRAIDGVGEDYFFTQKAQMIGFKVYVDTAMKCRHKGDFLILPRDDLGYEIMGESPNP